jgi:hypothetical protein
MCGLAIPSVFGKFGKIRSKLVLDAKGTEKFMKIQNRSNFYQNSATESRPDLAENRSIFAKKNRSFEAKKTTEIFGMTSTKFIHHNDTYFITIIHNT